MSHGPMLTSDFLICRTHLPKTLGPRLFTPFWNIPCILKGLLQPSINSGLKKIVDVFQNRYNNFRNYTLQ